MVILRKARVHRTSDRRATADCPWTPDVPWSTTSTAEKLIKAHILASRVQPLWTIYPTIQDRDPWEASPYIIYSNQLILQTPQRWSQIKRSRTTPSIKRFSSYFWTTGAIAKTLGQHFFAITTAKCTLAIWNTSWLSTLVPIALSSWQQLTTFVKHWPNSIASIVSLSAWVSPWSMYGPYSMEFWLVICAIQ